MENTNEKETIRVQILRGALPSQLPEKIRPHAQPEAMSEMNDLEEDAFWRLYGKPRFSFILAKSNVKPACILEPMKELLPPNEIDVVFTYCGKNATWCKARTQYTRKACNQKEGICD